METLQERIAKFVEYTDKMSEAYFKRMDFTHSKPPVHKAEYSEKWCKIVTHEHRGDKLEPSSVFCFVALQDFTNRTLGTIKAGDIHKAASYKAPAKHKRGSVFSEDFDNCCDGLGIKYLK
jgi:hypothetical protein